MAAASSSTTLPPPPDPLPDAFQWLKSMPLAPTYYPTTAEFEDPIAYIFKIEKEASQYGICKIVPPIPAPPKKTAIANLNRSLAARDGGEPHAPPNFTTRQQQIGFCPRKPCPVKRPVWESGESYNVAEFEAKAKVFEKHYLKKWPKGKGVSALEMETLFWKASADKPFRVEYANDMPGSAFAPIGEKKKGVSGEGNVGDSSWNMRGVSRAKGSLLKFMKEEIPGVTSPMLYIAMMFSWFAWHVEDHDLHSLNYLHMGAGKTWYGVPRDAAVAFEEVVRVQGYGEEVNALGTFAALGEKTTVISPEVFISAGVPCCRLVQYAGEFVVTFPRAYHSGFSHGFNCGEAANIATPEWLRVAKDAAIRRASINHPPMVSHFQLLYDLALSPSSRTTVGVTAAPRSSRLKDKKKNEGEALVKELFVQNVLKNNALLHILAKESSVVLLPQSLTENSVCPNIRFRSQLRGNPRLPVDVCRPSGVIGWSGRYISDDTSLKRIRDSNNARDDDSVEEDITSQCGSSRILHTSRNEKNCGTALKIQNRYVGRQYVNQGDRTSDQRLFSCVTCGILTFDCVAIMQPKAAAARHFMSADCSLIKDLVISSEVINKGVAVAGLGDITSEHNLSAEWMGKSVREGLYDVPVQSAKYQIQSVDQNDEMSSKYRSHKDNSALDLLAMTYGNSSDDEDDQKNIFEDKGHQSHVTADVKTGNPVCTNANNSERISSNQETELATSNHSQVVSDAKNINMSKSVIPVEETDKFLVERYDEDSSRIHVFCLEHAVKVEKQLRQIGGVHILLLCHPDYPWVEAEARTLAKEIGTDYTWNDISFRDATKKDKEQIQLALDSEEATPVSGDWAVKLGINLFYSANLSRSSLYSKQMPYNCVIYNAFGRGSPATSPTRLDTYSRQSCRKKKVVAGKWCGKVWMSNQVHPFLTQRDPDYEEEKEDRTFHGWAVQTEKPERKLEKNQNARTNTVSSKSGKRKMMVPKDADSDTSLTVNNCKKQRRIVRAKPIKYTRRGDISFAHSLNSSQSHHMILSKGKHSVESSEDVLDKDSLRHHGRIGKGKQSKRFRRDDTDSDDSAADFPYEQHLRNSGHQARDVVETEEADSEDSFNLQADSSSGKLARSPQTESPADSSTEYDSPDCRTHRGRYARCSERGASDSDNSMEDDSHAHKNRSLGGRKARYIEKRDSVSDDSLENISLKKCKNLLSKQTRCSKRSGVDSDDSSEDISVQHHCRSSKRKQRRSGSRQETRQNISQHKKQRADRPSKQGAASQARHRTSLQPKKETASEVNVRKFEPFAEGGSEGGPSTRLRKRNSKKLKGTGSEQSEKPASQKATKKAAMKPTVGRDAKTKSEGSEFPCDIEGCAMSFGSKRELMLHKKNICPEKGCGKKFFSHKYLVQHRKVHLDDRPLKCPWKGCKMTFKWPWARTEHIRVHTGARPYVCKEQGCGQTFRFVSDFSRHKRKTGHSAKKGK